MPSAPTNHAGILLAVEGIDGAGKTTQVELLAESLRAAGLEVVTSKEPTGGKWGQKIRESAMNGRLPLDEELEAFIRDRQEHVASTISPSLEQGKTVILDRYFYSTIAYQGERGADVDVLDRKMKELAPEPDMVIVLDVEPYQGLSRIVRGRGEEPNRFESADSLARVRTIFKHLCDIDDTLEEVDGRATIPAVHQSILHLVMAGPVKDRYCAKSYGCTDPGHCVPRLTKSCRWIALCHGLSRHFEERYGALLEIPWPSVPMEALG